MIIKFKHYHKIAFAVFRVGGYSSYRELNLNCNWLN